LELVTNLHGERKGSLLNILDQTSTPMGARRLRQWLLYPLVDEDAIRQRQDGVQELAENYRLREDIKRELRHIQDLERLSSKAVSGSALPKDLVAIKLTLHKVCALREHLASINAGILTQLRQFVADIPEVTALIESAIVDDPPYSIKDGGFIRAGFDAEVDEIRTIRSHAKEWIVEFEARERRRTGIQSLKVRYNRVFGYYIEVTKANVGAVPQDYLRKQTLANGERYITPELKEYETKVLNAEISIQKLESELLCRVRDRVGAHFPALKAMGGALAVLDVLVSLAEVAATQYFTRPRVDSRPTLSIRDGRHPVVESAIGRGAFVPNDCSLDAETTQIIMLTGPNMAGKSTYMRQVALIVVLAQMGSFVPAADAQIGTVDRIFTRIGAADSLFRGESTFMVEMKETANILHHATARSLVLLDEVGRGTSTFDGISIAWAVVESLHDGPAKPRTLFATHYHELTDLSQSKERVRNFNFAVKEWQGDIIFLRNLVAGAASHSYGIHVARLAGLPRSVIERAKEILARLEGGGQDRGDPSAASRTMSPEESIQLSLFESQGRRLRELLLHIDVSRMTPIEAINLLDKLSKEAGK